MFLELEHQLDRPDAELFREHADRERRRQLKIGRPLLDDLLMLLAEALERAAALVVFDVLHLTMVKLDGAALALTFLGANVAFFLSFVATGDRLFLLLVAAAPFLFVGNLLDDGFLGRAQQVFHAERLVLHELFRSERHERLGHFRFIGSRRFRPRFQRRGRNRFEQVRGDAAWASRRRLLVGSPDGGLCGPGAANFAHGRGGAFLDRSGGALAGGGGDFGAIGGAVRGGSTLGAGGTGGSCFATGDAGGLMAGGLATGTTGFGTGVLLACRTNSG